MFKSRLKCFRFGSKLFWVAPSQRIRLLTTEFLALILIEVKSFGLGIVLFDLRF